MKTIQVLTLVTSLLLTPLLLNDALAGSNSLITFGIGAEGGLHRHRPLDGENHNAFVGELTGRLRLFRILGAQFSFNLGTTANTGELSFSARFRLTAVIYLLPTERVSIYLLGGLGARDIRDLGTVTGETSSYHAGLGAEIYIGRRFAISLEYLWLVPGYASVERAITRRTEEARAEYEAAAAQVAGGASTSVLQLSIPDLSFTDFLDAGNFQVTLGLRFYI